MKKTLALLFLIICIIAFSGCIDQNNSQTNDNNGTDTTEPSPYMLAIAMIDAGEYENAYYALLELKKQGNEDARKKLLDFHVAAAYKAYSGTRSEKTVYNYTIDEFGYITSESVAAGKGDPSVITYENTYDQRGFLIKRVSSKSSDPVYEYSYASDGKLEKMIILYQNGESDTYTYIYDSNGLLIEKMLESKKKGSTNPKKSSVAYTYDSFGRCIKETESPYTFVTEYTYDEHGNIIKEIKQPTTSQTTIRTRTYDKNSNIISEKTDYEQSGYVDSNCTLENIYDEHGNLIKMTRKYDYSIPTKNTTEYADYRIYYRPQNPLNELPNIAKTIAGK